jgi:vacuolar-type H+-ATPase subunit E/Vma4
MNLDPLRQALRAETEAEAEWQRAEMTGECERIMAESEAAARALAQEARRDGERAAARAAARRRAAAARRARETVLAARRGLVDELRVRSRRAVLELREEPRYPALLERLSSAARVQLGRDTELVVDPPGRGGVIGRTRNASVDYTLPAMADRAVDGIGRDLERLWS